jgi:hypothetical protein
LVSVDGVLVGPAEPAVSGERLEAGRGHPRGSAGGDDRLVEAGDLALVDGHDVAQHGKVGAEPPEAAELGSAVGARLGVDVGLGLFPEAPQDGGLFAAVEFAAPAYYAPWPPLGGKYEGVGIDVRFANRRLRHRDRQALRMGRYDGAPPRHRHSAQWDRW